MDKTLVRKSKVLISIYKSSLSLSITAMSVVAVLEVFMLCYSMLNAAYYGPYLWKYRAFYIALLVLSVAYLLLSAYAKKDIDSRYKIINLLNPLVATLFFAWALGVTYADSTVTGRLEHTIFTTFSLIVPLSIYITPFAYAAIVSAADAIMLFIHLSILGADASIINILFFFIFQIVLGVSFLYLKMRLAEQLVAEEENAEIDVMTNLPNRRKYEEDIKKLNAVGLPDDFVYMAIDINGLKDMNDNCGHEAGDKLIIGAAQCMKQYLGEKGEVYRTGGDEFAAMLRISEAELTELTEAYEAYMREWSDINEMELGTSHGCASRVEFPEASITELAKTADNRMYVEKSRYYAESKHDRRAQRLVSAEGDTYE